MSRVFIVLKYEYIHDKDIEVCRVDRVYTSLRKALKRVRFLERMELNTDTSFHIITKKLKGKILNLICGV